MMEINLILSLLTAFGLGSVLTTLVQSWLSNRANRFNRMFDERKEAFIGLLEAYHKAAVEPSDLNSKNFAYWQMRCELVASNNVKIKIQDVVNTNNDQQARYVAHDAMKEAMRNDLVM